YSVSHAEDDVDNRKSSSNISASLGHKNGEFYFKFKFGISGLLHQWSLQIAYKGVGPSGKTNVITAEKINVLTWGRDVRRYVADPVNVSSNESFESAQERIVGSGVAMKASKRRICGMNKGEADSEASP
ncbi:hypothetical protein Tco_0865356, partial [Tanacetum coccineum]